MAELTTQSMVFAGRVLPALFHNNPKTFLQLLERDGNVFLRFYWERAGSGLEESAREPSFGLNHDLRRVSEHVTIALVSLPKPRTAGEAYFAACVYRPLRRTPFLGISDTSRVVTLEYAGHTGAGAATTLVEWDRRLEREELGIGPDPVLEDFFRAVYAALGARPELD